MWIRGVEGSDKTWKGQNAMMKIFDAVSFEKINFSSLGGGQHPHTAILAMTPTYFHETLCCILS